MNELSQEQISYLSEIDKEKDFHKWYCAFSNMIALNCKSGRQKNWTRRTAIK